MFSKTKGTTMKTSEENTTGSHYTKYRIVPVRDYWRCEVQIAHEHYKAMKKWNALGFYEEIIFKDLRDAKAYIADTKDREARRIKKEAEIKQIEASREIVYIND